MADRSLKGTGLGAKSFEDEAGVEFAARQEVATFARDIDTWPRILSGGGDS